MSDEPYRQVEGEETPRGADPHPRDQAPEKPPRDLGAAKKQLQDLATSDKPPLDLGVHRLVFTGVGLPPNPPHGKGPPEAILIVQEDVSAGERAGGVRARLIIACAICIAFIGLEFGGGFLSNSLVIAADAAQLLTVFSTLLVSMLTMELKVQGQGRGKGHRSIGLCRVEVVVILVSVLVTWVLTSVVFYLAFERIVHKDFTLDVDMMLATSAFGVVANLVMGMTLHNNCQVRQCSTGSTTSVNVNVRAAFLHIVFDFLFSLSVFITALFIDCCPDWHIVDPISTVVFSMFVLVITLTVLRDVIHVLIEGTPKGLFLEDVLKTIQSVDGVRQVQNMRVWPLGDDKTAVSVQLTIGRGVNHTEVLKNASRLLHDRHHFSEVTAHVEVMQGL